MSSARLSWLRSSLPFVKRTVAKTEHGKEAGSRQGECPARADDAARRRFAAAALTDDQRLPAVVGESLVRLRHAVDVVLALERGALLTLSIDQLAGETVRHVLLATLP